MKHFKRRSNHENFKRISKNERFKKRKNFNIEKKNAETKHDELS